VNVCFRPIADIRTPARLAVVKRTLADRLVALAAHDLETRQRLAEDGSLFEGYHPKMQVVHEANARELETIIAQLGWPGRELVGDDGAEAAWLIVQHAIGLPQFQRRCLKLLQAAAANGEVPQWQPAFLLDRILTFEGKPQVYGTSFDWDEDGLMSPRPIADPAAVDERRAAVGLPTLAEAIDRHRVQAENEPRPASFSERQRRLQEWAESVGWR